MSRSKYLPFMTVPDKEPVPLHDQILNTMIDMEKSIDCDVCWVSAGETLFQRLGDIFISAGGRYQKLKDEFPQYYD